MRRHREPASSRFAPDADHREHGGVARRRTRYSRTQTLAAVVVVSAGSLVVSCGGRSATAPAALPLVPGRQLLTLAGFASSTDPAFPPCTPIGQPADGTSVNTVVSLTQESGEWVARSAPAMGSVEVHLRSTGTSSGGYGVAGTITGTALDTGLMGIVRDVRVTLSSTSGGSATLDGETTTPASSLLVGRMTGALRFSDSQGLSSTCPAIQWSMQPY
jgi:FlaG/FlaF family flagellin (archaellin)